MVFSRTWLFFTGMIVIAVFYFVNRLQYVVTGTVVKGVFSYYLEEENDNEKSWSPVIYFHYGGSDFSFQGRETDVFAPGDSIPVLLQNGDPKRPLVYSVRSFWLYPLFWLILPVILWSAFSLSYVGKNEKVVLRKAFPFLRKSGGDHKKLK